MKCVSQCNRGTLRAFYSYGYLVGKQPIPFLVVSVVVCLLLSVGIFLYIDPLTDMETLYTPAGSEAVRDRGEVMDTFPDRTGDNYDPFSLNGEIPRAEIIFRSGPGQDILDQDTLKEIETFMHRIESIAVTVDGRAYTYIDLCARNNNSCVIDGNFIFTKQFREYLDDGNITYPVSNLYPTKDLSVTIGRPHLKQQQSFGNTTAFSTLQGAGSVLFTLPLRMDTDYKRHLSRKWELEFVGFMKKYEFNTTKFEIAFKAHQSLNIELDSGTAGDVVFFGMAFALMITYASIVSSGGDAVSTRLLLSQAGVVATVLGIVGAFGLVSMCGVRYVNMIGVMPFLLLGIGVDDMFLLMSSWSESTDHPDMTVPERVGEIFKKAGIGITITSLTNFLSFAIGASSVFRSVRNFCIYTGVGVIMCYLTNVTFFGACLALHGRRVYSGRHTFTCQKVKSQSELKEEGRNHCYRLFCGGKAPERAMEDQSVCERGPRYALPRFILWKPIKFTVLAVFAVYLGTAIWGCTRLEEGLNLNDLVLPSSYVHKYETWFAEDYGVAFPISFVTTDPIDYMDPNTLKDMKSLLREAQEDEFVNPDIEVCWLTAYASTPLYMTIRKSTFMLGLQQFLTLAPRFQNDVIIQNDTIIASRCHIYTTKIKSTNEQADLMVRMRDVADGSPAANFAYNPIFVYYEQFILILPSTLQTVGITMAVMMVVTSIFLPHPTIIILVMVQVIMIVTGIFGFMSHWDLTLSSITMVHLIMSVGLSVDFCAHVCTAYMVSDKTTREDRAKDAIIHASGPILNGGTSSFIGILGLVFSESFIFRSFFKVMMLVLVFGVLHAVFFVPVLLSFIGPKTYVQSNSVDDEAVSSNGHAGSKSTPEVSENGHNKSQNNTEEATPSNHTESPKKHEDNKLLGSPRREVDFTNKGFEPSDQNPEGEVVKAYEITKF